MSKTALLIIDLFNDFDFEGGDMLRKHTEAIVEPILELKKHFKELDLPVIYCNDNFGQWKDSTEDIIEYVKASKGEHIASQIEPEDEEYFIIKPRHSTFFGTQLDILLRQLNVTKLILTGVATDICILFSANDAYMRDYDIYVPRDCVTAETSKRHESALTIIDEALGIEISPVSEYMSHIQK
ncbi:cysteine hydrolase family protein [Exiguobacterium sp. SRB7LM]|uniref:cysteine hydrolase family protein n=1 Tax=Exiguobacterium sp. SRB7LM TaxID=2608401 RepID=UPI0018C3700C|nr:isochorismatase family cysteine hydrolase [Exiguobacterium sp. SRB7LM]MBG0918894.1 cysteine hydrolase [Exiguobacterium sp. SRB7LM]